MLDSFGLREEGKTTGDTTSLPLSVEEQGTGKRYDCLVVEFPVENNAETQECL
jgi:hypothetical protein